MVFVRQLQEHAGPVTMAVISQSNVRIILFYTCQPKASGWVTQRLGQEKINLFQSFLGWDV